jgi:hypothetical protein
MYAVLERDCLTLYDKPHGAYDTRKLCYTHKRFLHLHDYTVTKLGRPQSNFQPPWKSQISNITSDLQLLV